MESFNTFNLGDAVISKLGIAGIIDRFIVPVGEDEEYIVVKNPETGNEYQAPTRNWSLCVDGLKTDFTAINNKIFRPEFMNQSFNTPLCSICGARVILGHKLCVDCEDADRIYAQSKTMSPSNMMSNVMSVYDTKGDIKMCTFNLLIMFNNPNMILKNKIIEGVSNYGLDADGRVFWYIKNGHKSYATVDCVKFFGREFDFSNAKEIKTDD